MLKCVCVFAVWSSGNQPDDPSDSDSDSEEQVDFRINDWLIFHMDRNVSARTTLLVQLCPQGGCLLGCAPAGHVRHYLTANICFCTCPSGELWETFWTFTLSFVLCVCACVLLPGCSAGV